MVGRLILYHINEDDNVLAKLSASQYEFRASISTETALHEFVRSVEHCHARKKPTLLHMPPDQIKKTKVFERNFEYQIMDKKNAIRTESVLNRPGASGGILGPCSPKWLLLPPKWLLVPPQTKIVPPQARTVP